MDFETLLDEVIALLRRRERITYRALKRQFELDDELLADLRDELIKGQRVAVDEGGEVLVLADAASATPVSAAAAPAPAVQAPVQAEISADKRPPAPHAERRHLTVMFCDLVGSTALSARLDPEDFSGILKTYHSVCEKVITRFDGHVSQHLGDGVLAYFGYPHAHEDDARRAVKSALAIVPEMLDASTRLQAQGEVRLQVRVGIHTGLVVVGDTGGASAERLAMGETPNVAARMQSLAPPDGVLVSATTKRLAEGGFEFLALGAKEVSGLADPIEMFQVLRELDIEDSRDAEGDAIGQTALVGRESEVQLLQERWNQAKDHVGQVVMVAGDAGIGKSRLVKVLQDRVRQESGSHLMFRCSPYHVNSALHPIVDRLQRQIGTQPTDSAEVRRARLSDLLEANGLDPREALPLFAALLSIPAAGGGTSAGAVSQGQKRFLYELLVRWFTQIAEKSSLLLVWEDVHWSDPSTLELLNLVIEHAPSTAMLVLVTFRSEFRPPWKHSSNRFQFIINRFTPSQVEQMVARLTRGKRFPAEVMRMLVMQTDGVPLFVEEVTKLLLESGALRELPDRFELEGPLSSLSIPITLRDSLMARLDRQSAGRAVAQLGATVGREFGQELIEAVWPHEPALLHEGLAQLVDAELVFRRGLGARASYVFKHVLIQEVAYESLLRRTREEYHSRIVQVLEQRFPGLGSTQPEVLAQHYTGAGQFDRAIPYWRAAAERAIETSAHAEAIAHVSKAIELQRMAPESEEKVRSEITLHVRLGVALTALRGYGASEVERAYGRARELCYRTDAQDLMLPSLYGLWRFYLMRAEFGKARNLGQELLDLAQRFGNQEFLTVGHRALGTSQFYVGELEPARDMMTRVLDAAVDVQQRVQAFRYDVVDAWVTGSAYRAWLGWLMGDEPAALRDSDEAIATARRLKHAFSHALSLSFAGWLHQFRGDVVRLRECASEAMAVSREHGFEFWVGWNAVLQGWAVAASGDPRTGARQIQEGIKQWSATGSELGKSYFLGLQADSHLRAGDFADGLIVVDEALQFGAATGERFWEAELHRVKGELLAGLGRPAAEVAASLHSALEVAQAQGAKALGDRAAASPARASTAAAPLARALAEGKP